MCKCSLLSPCTRWLHPLCLTRIPTARPFVHVGASTARGLRNLAPKVESDVGQCGMFTLWRTGLHDFCMRVDSQGRSLRPHTSTGYTRRHALCGYTHENEQEKEARKDTRQA